MEHGYYRLRNLRSLEATRPHSSLSDGWRVNIGWKESYLPNAITKATIAISGWMLS
jgi:hypothetical protein